MKTKVPGLVRSLHKQIATQAESPCILVTNLIFIFWDIGPCFAINKAVGVGPCLVLPVPIIFILIVLGFFSYDDVRLFML